MYQIAKSLTKTPKQKLPTSQLVFGQSFTGLKNITSKNLIITQLFYTTFLYVISSRSYANNLIQSISYSFTMVTCRNKTFLISMNSLYEWMIELAYGHISLDPSATVFHYGVCCFEGISLPSFFWFKRLFPFESSFIHSSQEWKHTLTRTIKSDYLDQTWTWTDLLYPAKD